MSTKRANQQPNWLNVPTITLDTGICWDATCSQPPGAAHRSMHTRDDCRNSYLRFSCSSLKAARDLKPVKITQN